jgi:hypothetical protein
MGGAAMSTATNELTGNPGFNPLGSGQRRVELAALPVQQQHHR